MRSYKNELEDYIHQFNTRYAFLPVKPKRLTLVSEQKPSNYFIKDIYNRGIKLPSDNDLTESWFVELYMDNKCIFRQSTTNRDQTNLHEYEDDLCERIMYDIFNSAMFAQLDYQERFAVPYPGIVIKPYNKNKKI